MGEYTGTPRRLSNLEILEASKALASTVTNEYNFIKAEEIKPGDVRKLDSYDVNHVRPEIRHLGRLHLGLIGNIAMLMPPEDAPGLDHLAFLETVIRTNSASRLNELLLMVESILPELQQAIDGLMRVRKLGTELVHKWEQARGEHFVCEHVGGNELGLIGDDPSNVLSVGYTIDRQAVHPSPSDYANWLMNVESDYPLARLFHESAKDPIASFHLTDAPMTRSGIWTGYSRFVEKESGCLSGRMVGIQDPVTGIFAGDRQTNGVIDQLKGNIAERINLFVKRSNPEVATPVLCSIMDGAENADIADIVNMVALHYSEGTGRRRPLSEQGKNWLRGLGIIG